MAKREKRNKSRGSAGNNRKMGEDFLEKNRRKEGVREPGRNSVNEKGCALQVLYSLGAGLGKKRNR